MCIRDRYWSEALANQDKDETLKARFTPVAEKMKKHKDVILQELIDAQGHPVDIEGYYQPNIERVNDEMRASDTLNNILSEIE